MDLRCPRRRGRSWTRGCEPGLPAIFAGHLRAPSCVFLARFRGEVVEKACLEVEDWDQSSSEIFRILGQPVAARCFGHLSLTTEAVPLKPVQPFNDLQQRLRAASGLNFLTFHGLVAPFHGLFESSIFLFSTFIRSPRPCESGLYPPIQLLRHSVLSRAPFEVDAGPMGPTAHVMVAEWGAKRLRKI